MKKEKWSIASDRLYDSSLESIIAFISCGWRTSIKRAASRRGASRAEEYTRIDEEKEEEEEALCEDQERERERRHGELTRRWLSAASIRISDLYVRFRNRRRVSDGVLSRRGEAEDLVYIM